MYFHIDDENLLKKLLGLRLKTILTKIEDLWIFNLMIY